MNLNERAEQILHLLEAKSFGEAERIKREGLEDVVESLSAGRLDIALQYLNVVADLAGDAEGLDSLDYLIEAVDGAGLIDKKQVEKIYSRVPANRWL